MAAEAASTRKTQRMVMRGVEQSHAETLTRSFRGSFAADPERRQESLRTALR